VFRLTATDGIDTGSDEVTVHVENVNQTPIARAGDDQTTRENLLVALNGTASSDPDGDVLTFSWIQIGGALVPLNRAGTATPSFVAPSVGAGGETLVFELTVTDAFGGSAADRVTVLVQDGSDPPACAAARPTVAQLWPPNHRLMPVGVTGVSSADGGDVAITIIAVTQDEPVEGLGDGDTAPDAVLQGSSVLLRAERAGTGTGRVYRVAFSAAPGPVLAPSP
jgi:hypothetical protein